jgi:hypothetical protein
MADESTISDSAADRDDGSDVDSVAKPSRRTFLIGAGILGGIGISVGAVEFATHQTQHAELPEHGLVPVTMALHVHASASEGPASMEAQLVQAARTGVDVLWWTDHDQRLCAHGAPTTVEFTGPAEQTTKSAALWTWNSTTAGQPVATKHTFVERDDLTAAILGDRDHAVLLGVQAATGTATQKLTGSAEDDLGRTTLADLVIKIDVYPTSVSDTSFLSMEVLTSYRPASTGREAGNYLLSYRIGGGRTAGVSKKVTPTSATITLDAPLNQWTTVTIRPQLDLANTWPGVDGRDSSLYAFSLRATAAHNSTAEGYLSNLVFDRGLHDRKAPLAVQNQLIAHYRPSFPGVRQIQGIELSLTVPHLGWYGETIAIPDLHNRPPLAQPDAAYAKSLVTMIHAANGLASYCHPFGTSNDVDSQLAQDTATKNKAAELVANRVLDCDLIEVGYRARGGCDLAHHVQLWDTLSQNALFLTANGVSDDHVGQDWLNSPLNFTSTAWSVDSQTHSLLDAMRRGRLYFSDPAHYRGRLDISIDGVGAMGGVAVITGASTSVEVLATDLPELGSVVMTRVDVDVSGQTLTRPEATLTTLARDRFGGDGIVTVNVDTSRSCFVRFVVRDHEGLEVGFTNPLWLLRSDPRHGIPKARSVNVT